MKHQIGLIYGNTVGKVNPKVFDAIIGQNDTRKKLSFFTAAHSPETPIPTMIFTGSQGLGKTYMAGKVAEALGRKLVEVNCGNVESVNDFISKILMKEVSGNLEVTILLDEAHQLSSEITTFLLSILNPNKNNVNYFPYGEFIIAYDMKRVNVIFATTDAHMIFRPLLNRCKEIYFSIYPNEDLFKILECYTEGVKITCDRTDISYACRGRARDAFMLAQDIKRYCNMQHTNNFNNTSWKSLKEIFTIYPYGLNSQEVEFLKVVAKNNPISCNSIAVKMGVNADNIESEIEMRPKELGFVRSDPRGRILTEEGEVYLREIRKS